MGAMVTLGVTAICLSLLAFAGFMGFGKKANKERKVSYHDTTVSSFHFVRRSQLIEQDAKTVSSV